MGVFLKPHGIPCSIGVASLGQCLRRRCGCYLLFLVYKYIKKEIYVHDKWGYYGEIGLKWVIMASSLADGKHGLIYVFGRYMYLIHTCACACVNRFSIKWFSKLWKSSRVIFLLHCGLMHPFHLTFSGLKDIMHDLVDSEDMLSCMFDC